MSKTKKILLIVVLGWLGIMLIGLLKLAGMPVIVTTLLMFAMIADLRAIWLQK
jgi:hypothetical protein